MSKLSLAGSLLVVVAGIVTEAASRVAVAQGAVELSFHGPQPHFVAAWAPTSQRTAERAVVLARRVSLELQDVTLNAALKALTKQAGLRITYSPATLPEGKRVTLNASDIAVVTALTEMLFRSGLDVLVDRDGTLALVPCRHPVAKVEIADTGSIVGQVTDKATGAVLAGATVVVESSGQSAITNAAGRFQIAGLPAGPYTVRVRYIGYAPVTATVMVNQNKDATLDATLDVALERVAQTLDELVTVTPGGTQTELRAIPTPVSIVRAEEIAKLRPSSTRELFRLAVPSGVSFVLPSDPEQSFYSARGASSLAGTGAMKIYIDGVDAASYGINAVDPESIERIEVTRGPQASTLYGSDAAGGVVQIYTKRGSGASARPHVEATAEAGVVQTPYPGFNGVVRQRYAAAVRGGSAEATYNLGGGYMHLGDWVPNGELSAQSSPSAYGGLRYSRGLVTVELAGRYLVHNAGGPLNPLLRETGFFLLSQPFYEQRRFTNQTTSARVEITPAAWWRTTLTAGVDGSTQDFIQTRPRLTTPDDTLLSLATQQSRKVSLAVSSAAEAGIARGVVGSLVAGVDHYNWPTVVTSTIQALNTEGTVQTSPAGSLDVSRSVVTNTGYFAQAQLAIHDAVYVTGGVRLDENSSFGRNAGTAFAPRIGLSVSQQAGAATIKLRGSYGSAIRPPRPGQAFGSVSAFSVLLPNPQLAPERQRGWDGGLDVFFNSRVSLSLTGYTQTARDLILLAQVAPPTDQALQLNQYQNVGRVTNRGIEVEGSYSGNRFQFRGQYGYVRSRIADLGSLSTGDVRVGDRPLQVPVHTAGATFTLLPRTGTSITSSLTYIGSLRYYDTMALYSCLGGTRPCRADARDYVVDYPSIAKVNASVTQSLTRELSAFVTVDNVTNNQRHEANNGTAVIGRITSVGLHFSY